MLRHARIIGMVIAGIGVAVLLGFAAVAAQSVVPAGGDFRKAQMVRERNPGNAMYDLQFFIAATRLGFLVSGAVGGGLLAINGVTLMMLGATAAELDEARRRLERQA